MFDIPKKSGSKALKIYNERKSVAAHYTMVTNLLLHNANRVRKWSGPGAPMGLTPVETLIIIQILSFKWDEKHPFPAIETVAERVGISKRYAQRVVRGLQSDGLLKKIYNPKKDKFSKYDLTPLFDRLEEIAAYDDEQKENA